MSEILFNLLGQCSLDYEGMYRYKNFTLDKQTIIDYVILVGDAPGWPYDIYNIPDSIKSDSALSEPSKHVREFEESCYIDGECTFLYEFTSAQCLLDSHDSSTFESFVDTLMTCQGMKDRGKVFRKFGELLADLVVTSKMSALSLIHI